MLEKYHTKLTEWQKNVHISLTYSSEIEDKIISNSEFLITSGQAVMKFNFGTQLDWQ